jgi:hypothetical protein
VPPVTVTFTDPVVPPEQEMLDPEAVGITAEPDDVRVRVAVFVQPLESVTVTR